MHLTKSITLANVRAYVRAHAFSCELLKAKVGSAAVREIRRGGSARLRRCVAEPKDARITSVPFNSGVAFNWNFGFESVPHSFRSFNFKVDC